MESIYRGYTIKYNEIENRFETESEEAGAIHHATLTGIKIAIDRKLDDPIERVKPQPKQQAFALPTGYAGRYIENIVDYTLGAFGYLQRRYGSQRLYVWATHKRERERVEIDTYGRQFYQDTPENRAIAATIIDRSQALKKYAEDEHEKINELIATLKQCAPAIPLAELPLWTR